MNKVWPLIPIIFYSVYHVSQLECTPLVNYTTILIKITPLIYLIYHLSCMRTNGGIPRKNQYLATHILVGLLCSVFGDAFMSRHDIEICFLFGMVSFSFGHLSYIRGMGFMTTRLKIGLAIYIFSGLLSVPILHDVKLSLRIASTCYGFLLNTTLWRAVDRYIDGSNPKILIGACLFVVSDLSIGISKFVYLGQWHSLTYFVLLTYYAAQTFIATSVY